MADTILSSTIASVDDVAELLLRTWNARTRLINFADLKGVSPDDSTSALVRELLRRGGTEWSVRVLVDSQSETVVLGALLSIVWVGEQQSYRSLPPERQPHAIREAICDLTRLLIGRITRGPRGVDVVAPSVALLQRKSAKVQMCADNAKLQDSGLVDIVATSAEGDVIVFLGGECLALPLETVEELERKWSRWGILADSENAILDDRLGLIRGLNAYEQSVVLSQLRLGGGPRRLTPKDLPSGEAVVTYLASCPETHARRAAERLHSVIFSKVYRSVDEFLLGCLGLLLKPGDAL